MDILQLNGIRVAVVGLDEAGRSASRLLLDQGAEVVAMDPRDTPELRKAIRDLANPRLSARTSASRLSPGPFALAVVAPPTAVSSPLLRALEQKNVPVISELELGYRLSHSLCVAVTGASGKSTTALLVERILVAAQRKTAIAGGDRSPFSLLVERTRDLDFIVLDIEPSQLEYTRFFRPIVAVLLNAPPLQPERFGARLRTLAKLFANQQPFDWAIVQSEALAALRSSGVDVAAKTITFSANDRRADLYLDRTLIISRLPDWSGLLVDLQRCLLQGEHHAEDLMAAFAVGRVLRIPLEVMVNAVSSVPPQPHRCEPIAEIGGVRFYNDARAGNLDATAKAIRSMPGSEPGEPNVLLIAGGRDEGLEYHDIGPLLARRVKRAILLGENSDKLRAAWSLFTPCTPVATLLEGLLVAAENAVPGDVVLLSPACAVHNLFPDPSRQGEMFRKTIEHWQQTTRGGGRSQATTHSGASAPRQDPASDGDRELTSDAPGANPPGRGRHSFEHNKYI